MRILQHILLGGLILTGSLACLAQESGNNDYQYALIEAVKQKNLGNLSDAVKLYRLVIEDKPDCDVAYYELGSIYLMTGQVELAMGRLEQAYKLDAGNQWYTLAYLNALGAGEKFDKMIEILKEKVDLDPDNAEWEYQLASVYFSEGRVKKSLRILNRIEKNYLENGQPQQRFMLRNCYVNGKFRGELRFNYFGPVTTVENNTNPDTDQVFAGKWITDFELSYEIFQGIRIAAGVFNLFDVYPDENQEAISFNGIFPYPRRNAPFGFMGGFYYARLKFAF